jgi:aryl-alcohol dehydrogenase-like predicted oxidoreductase
VVFAHYSGGINNVGLPRKHIIFEDTKALYEPTILDYVNVIFAHRADIFTPLEDTCRAFTWVIDQGLAFYWGTSEWDADTIAEAIQFCNKLGLHKPIAEQCE